MMLKLYTLDRKPGVAKKLAKKFGQGKDIIFTEGRVTALNKEDIILNYGKSVEPVWAGFLSQLPVRVLNPWGAVKVSVDKVETFRALDRAGVPCLKWTTDPTVVAYFKKAMVRTLVKGTKGKGLLVINDPSVEEIPKAPLYTEYFGQTHEFRVHVFNNEVIDYTQKKKLSEASLKDRGITPVKYIRSHDNGWIFSRNDIVESDDIKDLAIRAAKAVGLDFGGIDIVAKVRKGKVTSCAVCETNAAPGMINTTFKAYVNAITKFLEDNKQ